MTEPTITCPNCQTVIPLTESLAGPLVEQTREQFRLQLAAKDRVVAEEREQIAAEKARLEAERDGLDALIADRLVAERKKIVTEETAKARRQLELDIQGKDRQLNELEAVLKARDEKLAQAQVAEVELLKKQRELEDRAREMDLTVERKVGEALEAVRTKARLEAEDALTLKVKERDTQIASMQHTIEELKRKAEQGSQQLQGEAQELVLEGALRARFPFDAVEPVAKGEFGGDVLQRVFNPSGQACGAILWESKRTKSWSDSWLSKVKGDQRAAKADLALIVSEALPRGVTTFGLVDGVWVTGASCAMAVAVALRESLILMSGVRNASEGQASKSALMYDYLTGPRFRHRVEAIVERFTEMQEDLARERRTMTRLWARREQQIHAVVDSTSGLYGDLQGIAGRSMIDIAALEIPLIGDFKEDED